MTTATLVAGNRTMDTVDRPRRSLEELVDQLIAALFKVEEPRAATQTASAETAEPSAVRSIHEARRLRQSGTSTGRWRSSPAWTLRRLRRGRLGGPSPSGRSW